jgi:hypothetical protein
MQTARYRNLVLVFALWVAQGLLAADSRITDENPLRLPSPGAYNLRILSPRLLELTLISTKPPDPAPVTQWNFISNGVFVPPATSQFVVTVDGQSAAVQSIGFKRRPIYAPLTHRDLRIGNNLYLQLANSITNDQTVQVMVPSGLLWSANLQLTARADPLRWNPAIHVNQGGYLAGSSKKAMVGEYLGSLGEMSIAPQLGFNLVETASSNVVYQGALTFRRDVGFNYSPLPYQNVLEADFSGFDVPGEYRLQIPGLGASFPFLIGDEVPALFTRSYALGLYHQRCGTANTMPYTRHTHGPCHVAPAEVPTMAFGAVNGALANFTRFYASNPRHTAPQLKDVNSSLYPFVNTNNIDVSGGHHDAGDYSKYTINVAQLIHALVFAVDAFPGVRWLDNLGLPESGDGISDLLQEAKLEADFLCKMQDADGGFYFLVYPRNREYENDVLPDFGDTQVVFPKNTAATAAAVAALAQTASSPMFRAYFPDEAGMYLNKALAGWAFLQNAIAAHGRDGSYQLVTHYGDNFMHDDELAWAATELFLATGDPTFQQELLAHFDPSNPATLLWTWWRLFEGYGCAVRSYAFAARTGRIDPSLLNQTFLAKCNAQILAAAEDQVRYARHNAYGSSFPDENKAFRSAGWYFSVNQAFDLTVAYQLDPKPEYREALLSNMNYEGGCNPLNLNFLTGIGQVRQREIVHQYAQNDRRVLPPSGLPLGNLQQGFPYLDPYQSELSALCFPPDYVANAPYAPYDKWGDTFNTTTEFVNPQQGRSLASMAFLMAQTPALFEYWNASYGAILDVPSDVPAGQPITASFFNYNPDLSGARFVWEARDQEPTPGATFPFAAVYPGPQWIEVEVTLPDGRRLFAASDFTASFNPDLPPNRYQSNALPVSAEMVALYHLDAGFADATGKQTNLLESGNAFLDWHNLGWLTSRVGAALRVTDVGDAATTQIHSRDLVSADTQRIVVEAMIYIHARQSRQGNAPLLSLVGNWNASLELVDSVYTGFVFRGGTQLNTSGPAIGEALTLDQWHHVQMEISANGYGVAIDGVPLTAALSDELKNWPASGSATLTIGNFDGWIDEVVIKNIRGSTPPGVVRLTAVGQSSGPIKIILTGPVGTRFVLQSSTNLLNWKAVLTNSLLNGSFEYSDSNASPVGRFFRALSGPKTK